MGFGAKDPKYGGVCGFVNRLKWSEVLCSSKKKKEVVHEPLPFEAPSMVEGIS